MAENIKMTMQNLKLSACLNHKSEIPPQRFAPQKSAHPPIIMAEVDSPIILPSLISKQPQFLNSNVLNKTLV